jgi:hypothetical protein
MLLALAPEVQPELLDRFLIRHTDYDKTYSEFWGNYYPQFQWIYSYSENGPLCIGGARVERTVEICGAV